MVTVTKCMPPLHSRAHIGIQITHHHRGFTFRKSIRNYVTELQKHSVARLRGILSTHLTSLKTRMYFQFISPKKPWRPNVCHRSTKGRIFHLSPKIFPLYPLWLIFLAHSDQVAHMLESSIIIEDVSLEGCMSAILFALTQVSDLMRTSNIRAHIVRL